MEGVTTHVTTQMGHTTALVMKDILYLKMKRDVQVNYIDINKQ